ncbi:hypothetical protein [Streptomyces sp. SID3343]|uniref:hypothetical protein n=1 Tax=Streptomyces sp. SID3343 TaxID=2690260 RepID=UPI00136CDBE6|nr:hypothetical protein [Streptomyces sp. SID3343]MYW06168.1 hypothetical protein [Streptomyces sp. SID3343]
MRIARALLAIGTAAVVTAGTASTAHAQAAGNPETPYVAQYGNSYVKGNLIWYNQSVQVGGQLRAASGCRDVVYTAYVNDTIKDRQVRSTCNGTVGHGFTLSAPVPGGATSVFVDLYENGTLRAWSICHRTGCSS